MATILNNYDSFAYFYNEYWGGSFVPRILPVLDTLALVQLPERANILDLCCGSGQLDAALAKKGYRVTGVDSSGALLDFARQNVPDVDFILADARDFHVPAPCAFALSVYDSLNHIMSIDDLISVFKNVRASLLPGASFIFDLNMDEGFKARWHGSSGMVNDEDACITKSVYDETAKVATMEITMFRLLDNVWVRTDLTLQEKGYEEGQVIDALHAAGFGSAKTYDAARDLGIKGGVGRTLFVARKA